MFCSMHDFTFLMTGKNLRKVSFESPEKKKLACKIFGKVSYVACAINHAGKLLSLCGCLHKCNCVGFIKTPTVCQECY